MRNRIKGIKKRKNNITFKKDDIGGIYSGGSLKSSMRLEAIIGNLGRLAVHQLLNMLENQVEVNSTGVVKVVVGCIAGVG